MQTKLKMKVDENKNQKLPRKLRKILVEKKRRERIDGALKQIKDMLFGTSELQNDYMRMEKADILESVVKYLQATPSTRSSAHTHAPGTCHARYQQGYAQCVREVTRLMSQLCGGNAHVTQSLSHFLNSKVTSLQQLTSSSHDRLHTYAQKTTVPNRTPAADDKYRVASLPVHTEATSTSGVSTNQEAPRVPPFHSPQSAFQRVDNANTTKSTVPSPSDNISIAVYQYNHYNNFKNDKSKSNVESNINIRPTVREENETACYGYGENSDLYSNVNARSNINIHPTVHSRGDSPRQNISLEPRLLNDHEPKVRENINQPFVKQESMWRPW